MLDQEMLVVFCIIHTRNILEGIDHRSVLLLLTKRDSSCTIVILLWAVRGSVPRDTIMGHQETTAYSQFGQNLIGLITTVNVAPEHN